MTVYNTFNYSYMERVQTWVNSPYIGTFQYKNAGPKRIHKKNLPPFIMPSSPYLGSFRHNLPFLFPIITSSDEKEHKSIQTDKPEMISVACQTEIDLSAYVIVDYK